MRTGSVGVSVIPPSTERGRGLGGGYSQGTGWFSRTWNRAWALYGLRLLLAEIKCMKDINNNNHKYTNYCLILFLSRSEVAAPDPIDSVKTLRPFNAIPARSSQNRASNLPI